MSEYPNYDKEQEYDDRVLPLLEQLRKVCKEEGIPFVVAFAYAADPNPGGKGLGIATTLISREGEGVPSSFSLVRDILTGEASLKEVDSDTAARLINRYRSLDDLDGDGTNKLVD